MFITLFICSFFNLDLNSCDRLFQMWTPQTCKASCAQILPTVQGTANRLASEEGKLVSYLTNTLGMCQRSDPAEWFGKWERDLKFRQPMKGLKAVSLGTVQSEGSEQMQGLWDTVPTESCGERGTERCIYTWAICHIRIKTFLSSHHLSFHLPTPLFLTNKRVQWNNLNTWRTDFKYVSLAWQEV